MTNITERTRHFAVADDGDIVSVHDYDELPTHNESIIQGTDNLASELAYESAMEAFEAQNKKDRERKIAEVALAQAGPHDIIGEHREVQRAIVDAVAEMSMYQGGEKGGYDTEAFQHRYKAKAGEVISGAKKNHLRLVNEVFPALLKSTQLVEAGFDKVDVDDMVNATRYKAKQEFGGPENKKKRTAMRKQLS